ncbi:MAG: HD domain-containing protein [Syntrophomonadaceae bacterium]|nr:HD domain-containing protein [Syntrophomonadaceae bacterium]
MKRIQHLVSDPTYQEYIRRNVEQEKGDSHCDHDMSHHFDVARITYILILEQNELNYFVKEAGLSSRLAAKEVIYAAGLLHDVGLWQQYISGECHATVSAQLARKMLPEAGFGAHEIDIICRAVFEHSSPSREMSFLGERLHRAGNLARNCAVCEHFDNCSKPNTREFSINGFAY